MNEVGQCLALWVDVLSPEQLPNTVQSFIEQSGNWELYLTITAVWVGQEQLATKSKYGHCYRNHVGQNFKYLMLWKGVG